MVFTVRCFKCGDKSVKLIMGGRSIIHARCHGCGANLLDEVMQFEKKVTQEGRAPRPPEEPASIERPTSLAQESTSTVEEDDQAVQQS